MDNKKLSKLRFIWIFWLILLILSAFIIPYQFLNEVKSISGAFLYWSIFAIVAIFSTIKITSYWRD